MEALEPDIVLPGRSSSSTPAVTLPNENGGSAPVVCALCLSAPGKYTCPRCNAPYCSLACYKGARHSVCSELFYKESVLQALRDEEAGPRGRRQIEEMLLKLREDERGEEPLSGLDGVMNGEDSGLWGCLSRREKEHFNRLIKSGHIGSLVPQWRPWWDTQELTQGYKIMEIPETEPVHEQLHIKSQDISSCYGQDDATKQTCPTGRDTDQDVTTVPEKTEGVQRISSGWVYERKDCMKILSKKTKRGHHETNALDRGVDTGDSLKEEETLGDDQAIALEIPPLLHSIPPLRSLTRNPSALVRFTLVNVIYSYSFSLLRHNGDLSDNDIMLDFIGTLLSISGALSTTTVYNTTAHALKSAVRAASDPLLGGDEGVAVSAMAGASKILLGDGDKKYSLAALSHLYHLLGKTQKLVPEEKDVRKGAFNAKKKCLFLAAWVNENEDSLAVLSAEVLMEYKQYIKDLHEMAEISKGLQQVWGGKRPPDKNPLIQEVN
ncbi:zinc finger HIT domain-containing protein 2 [Rhinoderma darwinii]|uniref:zinc finger HIT domain-containing protein 2 n=1 Tax=Rhinoderma darwinii TaxID=43563 RepID=UPI003F662AB9